MIEEVLKPHLIDALWLAYSSQNCLVFPHQCIIDFNLASLKTNHNFSAFQHMKKKKKKKAMTISLIASKETNYLLLTHCVKMCQGSRFSLRQSYQLIVQRIALSLGSVFLGKYDPYQIVQFPAETINLAVHQLISRVWTFLVLKRESFVIQNRMTYIWRDENFNHVVGLAIK